MLVKLGLIRALGNAIEVGKQVGGNLPGIVLTFLGGAQQIVDQHLGVYLFLNVERRCVDNEVAPVLLILAAPDKLWVKVGIARVANLLGLLLFLLQHGLKLRRRDVFALLLMGEGFDGF